MSREVLTASVEKITAELLAASNKTIDSLVNQALAERVRDYDTSYNYDWFKPEKYELPEFKKYSRERLPNIIGWLDLHPDKDNKIKRVYFTLCGRYFFREDISEFLYEKFLDNQLPLSKVNYDKIIVYDTPKHVYACQGCCDFLNRKTSSKICSGEICIGGINQKQKDNSIIFVSFEDYVSGTNGNQTYHLHCNSSSSQGIYRVSTRIIGHSPLITEFYSNVNNNCGNLTGQVSGCICEQFCPRQPNCIFQSSSTKGFISIIRDKWSRLFNDHVELNNFNNQILIKPIEVGLQMYKAEKIKQESDENLRLAEMKLKESKDLLEKLEIEREVFKEQRRLQEEDYALRTEQLREQQSNLLKEKEKLIRQTAIVEKSKKKALDQFAKVSEVKNLRHITERLYEILLEAELLVNDREEDISELIRMLKIESLAQVIATPIDSDEAEPNKIK